MRSVDGSGTVAVWLTAADSAGVVPSSVAANCTTPSGMPSIRCRNASLTNLPTWPSQSGRSRSALKTIHHINFQKIHHSSSPFLCWVLRSVCSAPQSLPSLQSSAMGSGPTKQAVAIVVGLQDSGEPWLGTAVGHTAPRDPPRAPGKTALASMMSTGKCVHTTPTIGQPAAPRTRHNPLHCSS